MMIKQTPPEMMSTEDRLNEVSELMMRGVARLKKSSGNKALREHMTGLQRQGKRPCEEQKGRKNP